MFAIENRAEDERPWAIIINIAPYRPRGYCDMAPATKRPIWPTDE